MPAPRDGRWRRTRDGTGAAPGAALQCPLMHVLHAATECAPLAKAGGLADVVGALPTWSRRDDPSVTASVLLPRYAPLAGLPGEEVLAGAVHVGGHPLSWRVVRIPGHAPFPLYLVEHPMFAEAGLYPPHGALERQAVLSHAAASVALASRGGVTPGLPPVDVLHAHDHHVALACAYARHWVSPVRVPTVLTIHNARYPGAHDWANASRVELPAGMPREHCDHDHRFNSLKCGVSSADLVTTVSPTHAEELRREPHASHGLDYAFRAAGERFRGILNGIDTETWNPASDPLLAAHYDARNLAGKRANKEATCREHGLDPSRPLIAYVGRLVPEKGVEQLLDALPLLAREEPDAQALVLGSGEGRYHDALRRLEHEAAPGRVRTALRHDEQLAHRLYAAADLLVMPSWYEPCGLSQMYALRYGTIPVVFPTGGLRDSVVPFDPATGTGTGVWMGAHDAGSLVGAVRAALAWWRDPSTRARLLANGMAADLSWAASAARYLECYRGLIARP